MIKLKDVSTSKLYYKILKRKYASKTIEEKLEWESIISIFDNNKIENYQILKDMLFLFETTKFFKFIKKDLEELEAKVAEANHLGLEPEIYTKEWYKGTTIDTKTLNITDDENKGDILLFSNPLHAATRKGRIINRYSIAELKFSLAHLQSDLRNEFKFDSGCYTKEDLIKIINLIKFYEEQVERQAEDIKESGFCSLSTNIFTFNKRFKQEIVESQLTEIAEYLVDSGNSYIWGNLTDNDKLRLLKVINQPKHFARRNLIETISNYTTLGELEQDVVKKKTLDRFITK